MDKLKLGESPGEVSIASDHSVSEKYVLLLAHGAGAGFQNTFLKTLGKEIASLNGTVIRFNFPYMEQGKKFPGPPKPNIESVGHLIRFASQKYPGVPLFISGKSYGGRMSSHWIAENPGSPERGIIYFGFPLHPPGKVSKDRATHLDKIKKPQLFVQGTNDALADFSLMKEVITHCKGDLVTIEHGDHSFKAPKKIIGLTPDEIIQKIATETNNWILKQLNQ